MALYPPLSELTPYYRDALGIFEALRRLGFPSPHIHAAVGSSSDGRTMFTLVLIVQEKEIAFGVEAPGLTPEIMAATWPVAAAAWNNAPMDEMQELWRAFQRTGQCEKIVYNLVVKGFSLPAACG